MTSKTPTEIPLIFLGLGNIGGALLRQVLECGEALARRAGVRVKPVALADVSGVLLHDSGLPERTLRAALDAVESGDLLNALPGVRSLGALHAALRPGAVLADLTASSQTGPTLRAALDAGCGVALANKLPLAGPWAGARALFEHPRLRYEVTVGAGLPVIRTLRYLLETGDRVTAIEGCLSGTLGYLCAELERGTPYAEAVAQARALGYTEPDPREDLGGKDVARKALILARTAGWSLEPGSIAVEPLYPESLAGGAAEDFLAAAPALNAEYAARVDAARAEDRVLRYVARVGPEGGAVGLVAVPREGALGALRGPANYIALTTERYREVPLALSGPGAGREVTAAGVLGDVLSLGSGAR